MELMLYVPKGFEQKNSNTNKKFYRKTNASFSALLFRNAFIQYIQKKFPNNIATIWGNLSNR
jgi:hypothetical protein